MTDNNINTPSYVGTDKYKKTNESLLGPLELPTDDKSILQVPPDGATNKYKKNDGNLRRPVEPPTENKNVLPVPSDCENIKYKRNEKNMPESEEAMDWEPTPTKPAPVLHKTTIPRRMSHMSGALGTVTKQRCKSRTGRYRYNTLPGSNTNLKNKPLINLRIISNIKKNKQISINVPSSVCQATQTPTSKEKEKVVFVLNTLDYLKMPGTLMWSNHVDYIMYFLQNKFPEMDGSEKYVKILNIRKEHWITVSNVFCQDKEAVNVYDSARGYYGDKEKYQVCEFVRPLSNNITISFPEVQQQSFKGNNCGFFAFAFAFALYSQIKPEMIKLDEKRIRQSCLEMLQK